MKNLLLAAAAATSAAFAQPLPLPPDGVLVIDTSKVPQPARAVYRAETETKWRATDTKTAGHIEGKIQFLEGFPERVVLSLSGEGTVVSAKGPGLEAWSERREADGSRFLELIPAKPKKGQKPADLAFVAETEGPAPAPGAVLKPLLPGIGESAGFTGTVAVLPENGWAWDVAAKSDLEPAGDLVFFSGPSPALSVKARPSGSQPPPAELAAVKLAGVWDAATRTVVFAVRAKVVAREAGARIPFLRGAVALGNPGNLGPWVLVPVQGGLDLVASATGSQDLELRAVAATFARDGWRRLDFAVPSANLAEVTISGLPENTEFLADSGVPLSSRDGAAVGWLPSSGYCNAGWREASGLPAGDTLFFDALVRADTKVGPGLVTQETSLAIRVLQGKMGALELWIDGPGDILDASGTNSAGWSVETIDGRRLLRVNLSRPVTGTSEFRVRSQQAVGAFPARIEPLRLLPRDPGARVSGLVRLSTAGAVRFDVAGSEGLVQVAPQRWGETRGGNPGQVFQFFSAEYALAIEASQVFPEVAVNQVTVYELAQADRVIRSQIELDIREAPLRDWEIGIPSGYAVASLSGTEVADYQIGADAGGTRPLRVIFAKPVQGRAALDLRLETSSPAAAGTWALVPLGFPSAKSARGFVGVASAPGFRLSPGKNAGLAETPLGFYPGNPRGLQLAFRQREPAWSADISIEALGQSVAADLFHLYSLRENSVSGSVILNFFIVGSPVQEWKLRVPKDAENLAIDGQDVRSWRREGEDVIVSLDRPALGAATLLATFEYPLPPNGGQLALGRIEPVGASSERGFVQVVSPLQVKSSFAASDTLLPLEPSELPAELRLLSAAPSLGVYGYASRPFSLGLKVEPFPRAETVAQIVDFAKLHTRVSGDGQIMSDAKYFVKSRGSGAFAVELPPDSRLWEARVGGALVTARSEGKKTLVPLPPSPDPDTATEISLRFGSKASFPWKVNLAAPTVEAPVLASEWRAEPDPGRVLVAASSPSLSASRTAPESGFEWFSSSAGWAWILGGAWAGALVLTRAAGGRVSRWAAVAFAVAVPLIALAGAFAAFGGSGVARHALDLAVPVAGSGQTVGVPAWNLPKNWAGFSLLGALTILAGIALATVARTRWRIAAWIGWFAISLGLLAQPRGGVLFLAWAAASAAAVLVPRVRALWAPSLLALIFAVSGTSSAASHAAVLLSLDESGVVREGASEIEARFVLDVKDPSGGACLLLARAGTPTAFSGEGLSLRKIDGDYYVAAQKAGRFAGTLRYTIPTTSIGGELILPTAQAAARSLEIRVDQPGWGFSSSSAVETVETGEKDGAASAARLTLAPSEKTILKIHPKRRDPSRETLGFFASANQLFVPGPGVLQARIELRVSVSSGEMRELRARLPEGFLLESVEGKIFGGTPEWSFDPSTREARIALPSPQRGDFSVGLSLQKPSGNLPASLEISPLEVIGAESQSGLLALAFPGDAQPEALAPDGLTAVNFEDFPAPLPEIGDSRPTLHRVFRYSGNGGKVGLRVLPVEPEIRATVAQTLSIGSERCVLSAAIVADIRRAAVFRLSFPLPAGWEVESASGDSLAHWMESGSGDSRKAVFVLKGRTAGEQSFTVSLSAPGVPSSGDWEVPRILLDGSSRTEGKLVLVPERGLRLQPLERVNCSPSDPRESGDLQPGSLAFRILQQDWKLGLAIEPMEPWITAQALENVEIREGQISRSAAIRFRAEHAAIKSVRVSIPGLDPDAQKTVRFEGEAVADFAPSENGVWEVRFRRGMIGEIPIQIEFQQRAPASGGPFSYRPVTPLGARQLSAFSALRASGRLELDLPALPQGWERVDWNAVPEALRNNAPIPAATLREPPGGGALEVGFRRQEIADALKLRVSSGSLATVFSPRGDSATAGKFEVRVNEKSTMRLGLPESAKLVRLAVNGEDQPVVKDGHHYLFYVLPPAESGKPAAVEFAYGIPGGRGTQSAVALDAPSLNAPLENLAWTVRLPAGWKLRGSSGNFEMRAVREAPRFGIDNYLKMASSLKSARAKDAADLMAKAGEYLRAGEQSQARSALNRAAKTRGIDEATNEDARVQLQNLASQQAVLGLNTRRQKLYLDNASPEDASADAPIAQAARANPLLQGQADIAPAQIEQILQGNSLEEAGALRRLADRIVSQQLAAEPAPQAVNPTLPETGTAITFTRGLQVDGARPLGLKLDIAKKTSAPLPFAIALAASIAIAAWAGRKTASGENP